MSTCTLFAVCTTIYNLVAQIFDPEESEEDQDGAPEEEEQSDPEVGVNMQQLHPEVGVSMQQPDPEATNKEGETPTMGVPAELEEETEPPNIPSSTSNN